MRHATSGFLLALLSTAVVTAQDSRTTTTQVKSDNGTVVTAVGCVMIGGATNFMLTNITSTSGKQEGKAPLTGVSYALIERDGVDLGSHIQQKVELTGVIVPAATKGDKDDKFTVKETTKADVDQGADKKSSTKTTVKVARGASGQFLVASVKRLAPTCEP